MIPASKSKRGNMTGRRLVLILLLILGITAQAGAAVTPLIIKVASNVAINTVVAALGGTLVDSIPGANTYLVNVPWIPSSLTASLLGIQALEINNAVALPSFVA